MGKFFAAPLIALFIAFLGCTVGYLLFTAITVLFVTDGLTRFVVVALGCLVGLFAGVVGGIILAIRHLKTGR